MNTKIIKGSAELGKKIRLRRNELGFTIEEAASKAGVGTKTWSRYESGESIRRDKVLNVCKVLNWHTLPDKEETSQSEFDINEYKNSEAWPQTLADTFGNAAAISFAIGSDILLDNVEQDLETLSHKPKGTHIGELDCSWMEGSLPFQFLMQYDYDFLYYLKSTIIHYRNQAAYGIPFIARTVMEELALYLIMEESKLLMETIVPQMRPEEARTEDGFLHPNWDSWPFDLFGDMDIITFLYSNLYLDKNHSYHFNHWQEEQFHCSK